MMKIFDLISRWVRCFMLGVTELLFVKEKKSRWGRWIWRGLRAMHERDVVQKLEVRVLPLLLLGPLFDPQVWAGWLEALGESIPDDLIARLSRTQAQYSNSRGKVLPMLLYLALVWLAVALVDVGIDALIIARNSQVLMAFLNSARPAVVLWVRLCLMGLIVCAATFAVYYTIWMYRTLVDFYEYLGAVRDVRKLLRLAMTK
jgi:hypothetical protein